MINWQPISTAPLDGTDVLVYDGYDVWKAWYNSVTGLWTHSVAITKVQRKIQLFYEPTHWLPVSDLLQPLGHLQ